MDAPCRDCKDRRSGCHSDCKKYIAFTAENQKRRAKERNEKLADYFPKRNRW